IKEPSQVKRLLELSSLVGRGKAYQEEREDYLNEAFANAVKQANMRASGHRGIKRKFVIRTTESERAMEDWKHCAGHIGTL
ncbi:hypothetical protein V496_00615, partial [Pseudogymnoascus sp. VKM F-4515 (FW-2607)]